MPHLAVPILFILAATAAAADPTVALDWDDHPEGDVATYRIYRSTGSSVSPVAAQRIATVSASAYRDTSVGWGARYRYLVTAVDQAGQESPASPSVIADIPSQPVEPPVDGTSVVAIADAMVRKDAPDRADGTRDGIQVRASDQRERVSYLRFPAPTAPGDAWLEVYVESQRSDGRIAVVAVGDDSWAEGSITWATAPARGATLAVVDVPAAAAGTWIRWDLSALPLSPGDTLNLALVSHDPWITYLGSREGDHPPRLIASGSTGGDTTPPSAATGLVADAVTASTVRLGWSPASDDRAVTGYAVERDGAIIATADATSFTDAGVAASRSYRYRVAAMDAAGNRGPFSAALTVTTLDAPSGRGPYLGVAHAVPGIIEAEHYDEGGAGIAFHDTSSKNHGGATLRGDAVDLEATTDAGGGLSLGWTKAGEWLAYTIDAPAGTYALRARVAVAASDARIRIAVDGVEHLDAALPATGGWRAWESVDLGLITCPGGEAELRIEVAEDGWNLNRIELLPAGAG